MIYFHFIIFIDYLPAQWAIPVGENTSLIEYLFYAFTAEVVGAGKGAWHDHLVFQADWAAYFLGVYFVLFYLFFV